MACPKQLKNYFMRSLRFIVHFASSVIFGLLYGKPKPIPPVSNHLLLRPATDLAEKIRRRQVKSEDIVEAYILRIKEVQPIINAVVDERFDEALREARNVDELIASGQKTEEEIAKSTPLLGVPFSCKEHIAMKGMSFTAGLLSRKGIKADEDSEVVKRLRKAGAIPIASTNIPELCMWWEAQNKIYGTTSNPYDTRRTSGGSSGGEGALISSCGSVFGLGSDFGSSIRAPAFMNGIFGHKPSSGAVPHKGYYFEYPEAVKKYFVIGPMCRYAADLRPVMKVLTNNDPKLKLDLPVDFRRLKVFYAKDCGDSPLVTPVVPEIKAAMRKVVEHFESTYGCECREVTLPELSGAFEIWFHVVQECKPPPFTEAMTEGKGRINIFLEFVKLCFRLSSHTLHSLFFAFLESISLRGSSDDHKRAMSRFASLKRGFDDLLQDNCVFLYPTLPDPAPFHHQTLVKYFDLDYTGIFNVLGFPSTQSPVAFHRGLPVGLQCVANTFNDRLTLAVAEEIESIFGGWKPPSPIACRQD